MRSGPGRKAGAFLYVSVSANQTWTSGICCFSASVKRKADPNPEISLIEESSAVREDSDAWCASCSHELLLQGGGAFSKGAVRSDYRSPLEIGWHPKLLRTRCRMARRRPQDPWRVTAGNAWPATFHGSPHSGWPMVLGNSPNMMLKLMLILGSSL